MSDEIHGVAGTSKPHMNTEVKNLLGQKFNRLTVIEFAGINSYGNSTWRCRCDCGNEKTSTGYRISSGKTQSCGCKKSEDARARVVTHDKTNTSEFKIWTSIKTRITNPKTWNYSEYGGRGIKMCDRWRNSFEAFLEDMGPKPTPLHSVDRFPDQNGNYEPSNCRWATQKEQCRNKRNNHLIEYNGETHPLSVWTERLGFRKMTLRNRLVSGWSIHAAMTEPEKEKVLRSPRRRRTEL